MKILSVVAIAALVATGACRAADDKVTVSEKAPAAGQQDQQDQQDAPIGSPAQVTGKIISIHSCTLAGMSDPHVLVKLESAPGDVEIVDLGSAAELKSNGIEPRQGQQFWVDGLVGKINGKPLVVAERLSESKLVVITHQALRVETTKHADTRKADTAAGNEAKDANTAKAETVDAVAGHEMKDVKDVKAAKIETVDASHEVRVVEGTVIHTRKIKIEGERDEHVFAKLQTETGIVVLDLGSCATLPANVDLSEGKSIAASGVVGHLNSKPILVAESAGNLSSIQRPNELETTPAKASLPAENK